MNKNDDTPDGVPNNNNSADSVQDNSNSTDLTPDKRLVLLTAALTLLPVLAGVLLWNRLPDRVATHFNFAGEPDGWSGRGFTVFGIPLAVLAIHLFCIWAVRLDPRRENVNRRLFSLVLWICPLVSLFVFVVVYGNVLGLPVNNSRMGMFFLGFIFLVVGNYLPKCRQNYTVGIKLPWTLTDEENWNRTHRLAGPLWVTAGVLELLASLLGVASAWAALVPVFAAALIPCVYSAVLYWKTHKA